MAKGLGEVLPRRHRYLPVASGVIIIVALVTLEVFRDISPHPLLVEVGCKVVADLAVLAMVVQALRDGRGPRCRLLALTVTLYAVADVAISLDTLVGIICFGVANLVLCVVFLVDGLPRIWQLACAGVTCAVTLTLAVAMEEVTQGFLVPVMIYIVPIAALAALALTEPSLLRWGALTFVASDILLGVDHAIGRDPVLDVVALVVYYLGVWLISVSLLRECEALG